MIIVDTDGFFAYTIGWLKQSTPTYQSQVYQLPSGNFGNAIDDQVLAQVLFMEAQ